MKLWRATAERNTATYKRSSRACCPTATFTLADLRRLKQLEEESRHTDSTKLAVWSSR